MMDDERRVVCRENQCLVDYLLQKKREQVDKPEGLSVNMERTFVKAYRNVCDSKDPISTLKDLSHIKYVSFLLSIGLNCSCLALKKTEVALLVSTQVSCS